MAQRKADRKAADKPRDDGRRLLTSRPEKLELARGEVYTGTLGAPKPGQYGISRTLITTEGKFWLPNHAALDAVFSLPTGAKVELTYKGQAKNKAGKTFHDWEAYELPADGGDADGLPF